MLELELLWLEWTAGQESAATMSLVLLGLVLALAVYGFFLLTTMRLRIFQEIFGRLTLFGPFLFPVKEIGCVVFAVLLVGMAILAGLWIFVLW
jgi:hypothetical protein